MDSLHLSHDPLLAPRDRGPVAIWLLAALIGLVLGVAALVSALASDSRDFVARHCVLSTRAM
jgi:hypothetical protein